MNLVWRNQIWGLQTYGIEDGQGHWTWRTLSPKFSFGNLSQNIVLKDIVSCFPETLQGYLQHWSPFGVTFCIFLYVKCFTINWSRYITKLQKFNDTTIINVADIVMKYRLCYVSFHYLINNKVISVIRRWWSCLWNLPLYRQWAVYSLKMFRSPRRSFFRIEDLLTTPGPQL